MLEVLVATESLVAVLIVRNPLEVVAAVPMPTKPSLLTYRREVVALVMLKALVTPSEFETFTERTALGVVEAIPSLPSMYVLRAAKDPREVPPETVSPVVVAFWKRAPTKVLVEVAETENKVEVPPWPFT